MKKKIIFAAGAVLVAAAVSAFVYVNNEKSSMSDLFNANVEALARIETGILGHCMENYGDCVAFCPKCGAAVWAPGHQGPSYGTTGECGYCD